MASVEGLIFLGQVFLEQLGRVAYRHESRLSGLVGLVS